MPTTIYPFRPLITGTVDSGDTTLFPYGHLWQRAAITRAGLFRFVTTIDQGATIDSAVLRLTCASGGDFTGDEIIIDAADEDAAAMPTANAAASIDWTTASVTTDFGVLATGQRFASASIASVVQEVVSRGGFSGPILLRVRSDSATSGLALLIAAEENTDGYSPASLVTEWTPGGGGGGATSRRLMQGNFQNRMRGSFIN